MLTTSLKSRVAHCRILAHPTSATVIRVNSAMSELRPLMLQDRRQSGHRKTSDECRDSALGR